MWSEHKLKRLVKNSLGEIFLQYWEECKTNGLNSGKLTLFYKLKIVSEENHTRKRKTKMVKFHN